MEGVVAGCRETFSAKGLPALATLPNKCSRFPRTVRIQFKNAVAMPFQASQTRQSLHVSSTRGRAMICSAAEQTQTITRQSTTVNIAPTPGKEKSPELDDGGTGFPPRDDDGDGGGGGGGGPNWSGGFFFFGFLALIGLLKDKESENPNKSSQKRRYSY